MPGNPLDAYKEVERNTLEGRALEAMVLSKAAMALSDVRNNWDAPDRRDRLDFALRYNQKLWTFFQITLMSEDNKLPAEVKANLLSLSAFVDKRTLEAMAAPAPEKLDVLININQNISAGLRGEGAAASQGG
jgi:flagellar protein FlaF